MTYANAGRRQGIRQSSTYRLYSSRQLEWRLDGL